ncbi:MAG: hypothetical protein D6707_01290, partial [Bacteroidetes bacterium]
MQKKTMIKNKIYKDEIDWLIIIANTVEIDELKNEAIEKLHKLGLNDNEIKEKFENLKTYRKQKKAFEKAIKRDEQRNESEKYTLLEQIGIFFFGPYDLFKFFDSGLQELRENNYKTKFRQRLILLIAGTIFWIAVI